VEVVRGVELDLHPSPDYVSDVIRSTGDFYEAAILDALAARMAGTRPGVIVDAGAMIGNHTAYFAWFLPHVAIHAFEPVPENLALLRPNVARYPEVTVHPIALDAVPRSVRMLSDPENRGHSFIASSGVMVESRPLDSYELQDVTLIKIDTEGSEPEVLAGARATIARCRPLVVLEDWQRTYASLLPGYEMVAEWEQQHQTFLFSPLDKAITTG
jgi:FkbM family methyltransferase